MAQLAKFGGVSAQRAISKRKANDREKALYASYLE